MPRSSAAVVAPSRRKPKVTSSRKGKRSPALSNTRAVRFDALPEHEAILVDHDLISQADLDALRSQIGERGDGGTAFDILIERGVYTAEQLELCLTTDAWMKRSTTQQLEHVTSEDAIARYRHEYALNAWFAVPHLLSCEELYALDLALHRISLAHVDSNPKHKLYHSIGGSLLFQQQAFVNLIGHPAMMTIARAFLGDDLIAGKPYLKVDEPYFYRGMFGHTHAETHYDCLTRGMYMFLYMDATGHDYGAFQVIPGSHERYTRGSDGRTQFDGKPLEAQSTITSKASLTHDDNLAKRWAGYESLTMPGNTLVALSPFLWHAVRPVMHRRRLIFLGYFDAKAMTRNFVTTSDYFGPVPYDLNSCSLTLLNRRQRELMEIHLDRDAWLKKRML